MKVNAITRNQSRIQSVEHLNKVTVCLEHLSALQSQQAQNELRGIVLNTKSIWCKSG